MGWGHATFMSCVKDDGSLATLPRVMTPTSRAGGLRETARYPPGNSRLSYRGRGQERGLSLYRERASERARERERERERERIILYYTRIKI